MCFDASQIAKGIHQEINRFKQTPTISTESIAKNDLAKEQIATNYYHVNGFSHPELLAFEWNKTGLQIDFFNWGLIPHWVNTAAEAKQMARKTLNARGETIFEKPSFREAARQHRIVLPLDGFFEHHHKKGKKIPHFIQAADGRRLMVAAVASEWLNSGATTTKTLSIVTCTANKTMAYIHNNPKLKGPRMPLLLDDEQLTLWLTATPNLAQEIIRPNQKIALSYFPVRPLRGNLYTGNHPTIQQKYVYPETYNPPNLFG